MKFLGGEYYVEVKDHRYKIHATEKKNTKKDPPSSLRTQIHVQNETQTRKNQMVIKNENNELLGKNYPKRRQPIQQQKFEAPNCPNCRRNNWLEFDKGY